MASSHVSCEHVRYGSGRIGRAQIGTALKITIDLYCMPCALDVDVCITCRGQQSQKGGAGQDFERLSLCQRVAMLWLIEAVVTRLEEVKRMSQVTLAGLTCLLIATFSTTDYLDNCKLCAFSFMSLCLWRRRPMCCVRVQTAPQDASTFWRELLVYFASSLLILRRATHAETIWPK